MNQRLLKNLFFSGLLLMLMQTTVHANNIQVSNVTLTDQNTADGYWLVQFDLSWENSWRTDNLFPDDGHDVGNWDAAWVFVKYRVGNGEWQHAKLHSSGHSMGSGTPATLRIGVPNEREAFHSSDNPGVGAFIYRSENGTGTFSTTANQLRWNYGVDDVPNAAELDIKVFAIEMVYVAPGPFWLGSGGSETGRFHAGGSSDTTPFQATESWNGCIENTVGCLWGASTSSTSTIGGTGNLHEHFPTGVEGFYSMKYSVSQQQYVDFLNTLTPSQANQRRMSGGFRNEITVDDGVHSTTNPYVANNFMEWKDGAAYMSWSGLRPMTELEYEKAARGPANPVPNEFAWGSTSITRATGLSNAGQADEVPTPAGANANYSDGGNPIGGPVRVGSFAHGSTTRSQSGAGYWGIMELSGNLSERPITVGNSFGRSFMGVHGSGAPSPGSTAIVAGIRGGGWASLGSFSQPASELRVSYRGFAAREADFRESNFGFRGVRSLPFAVGDDNSEDTPGDWPRDTETEVITVINPTTGHIWMDRNLGASRAATSSTDAQAYGDLYQWGRAADGHQKRNSPTTSTLSSTDQPGHGDFILTPNSPNDWRSPQNNNLWQGVNGINNPCPSGYRLPTEAEWNAERNSWSSNNESGAINSPLKLPLAGTRSYFSGSLVFDGSFSIYWSSTVSGSLARVLRFGSGSAILGSSSRAYGYSVRCLEDSDAATTYSLELDSSPVDGGTVSGAGEYEAGANVTISATPNEGYAFVNWTGDVEHVTDPSDASTTVSMPAANVSLTANFEEEDEETEVVTVTSPTGRVWMDRNLGASRAATSSTDSEAYGDLYQWGRAADGHQNRNSSTTSTLSNTDQPGHGDFITSSSDDNWDWRSPQNNNLWQGVNGVNNPCPSGYRLPTEAEWNAERNSWSSNNASGAFNSPLKLPMAGFRSSSSGSLSFVGSIGYYWSSTVSGSNAWRLNLNSSNAIMSSGSRAGGLSVRCLEAATTYSLELDSSPVNGGTVSGAGEYDAGANVTISATPNEGYAFVNWTGDVEHVSDVSDATTTVSMPAASVSLTANFEEEDDDAGDWPRDTETTVVTVTSPTGRVWMDRNLGASRAATSSTDSEAYGDLYQWGRAADGHQKRNSPTTSNLSSIDQPGHGHFILTSNWPFDWRSPRNDNLWQGASEINNPCPSGYRLPTDAEWHAERNSWSSTNFTGAFNSPLKLPLAGLRSNSSASVLLVGSEGRYWSSTVSGSDAGGLAFSSNHAEMYSPTRARGLSVRCLED